MLFNESILMRCVKQPWQQAQSTDGRRKRKPTAEHFLMPQLLSPSEDRLIFQGFFSDFFSTVPRLCLYSALRRDHCRCKKQLNHHQLTLLLSKRFLILFPGMDLFLLFYGGKLEALESLNTAQGHPEGTQNAQHFCTPVLGLKNSLGWRRK